MDKLVTLKQETGLVCLQMYGIWCNKLQDVTDGDVYDGVTGDLGSYFRLSREAHPSHGTSTASRGVGKRKHRPADRAVWLLCLARLGR